MDPPSRTPQFTIKDFLSKKKIAVRFSTSDAYRRLCEILIEDGYDSSETLANELPKKGDAIVYNHNSNTWIQKGTYEAFIRLGYVLIEAEDLVDVMTVFDSDIGEILSLLEDT